MAVPPEFIEDLRQRVPLSDVIGRRVKLTKTGRRYTGLPVPPENPHLFRLSTMRGFTIVLGVAFMVMRFHFCVKWMG